MNSSEANGAPVQAPQTQGLRCSPLAALGWCAVAILLASNAPLFICLPLTDDARMYDIQVRTAQRGGVLYRDVLEPNLPGVHTIHWLVRSTLGWSSEALHAFDLLSYCLTVALVVLWVRRAHASSVTQAWLAFVLFLFYLSGAEWIHCQRDMWMLVPTLLALHLRLRKTLRLSAADRYVTTEFGWSMLEGLVWGIAVWIKPHVVIPAAAVWTVSAIHIRRPVFLAKDFFGLLLGGLAMGIAGVWWLWRIDVWPHLWQTMSEWNPLYFRAGKQHWVAERFYSMLIRFIPWFLIHAVAIPLGISRLIKFCRSNLKSNDPKDVGELASAMLAALFVSWTGQVFFLQHLFDYVYAPTVLLGCMFLALEATYIPIRLARFAIGGFLLLALLVTANVHPQRSANPLAVAPVIRPNRLAVWPACFKQGSSSEVRDRLTLSLTPVWSEVADAAEYLKQQNVKETEMLVYSANLLELYFQLDLNPPTRYVYVEQLLHFFPTRHYLLREELQKKTPRFVVVDLATMLGIRDAREIDPSNPLVPPKLQTNLRGMFPWSYPIVFRSGSIAVFQVNGPIGEFTYAPMKRTATGQKK